MIAPQSAESAPIIESGGGTTQHQYDPDAIENNANVAAMNGMFRYLSAKETGPDKIMDKNIPDTNKANEAINLLVI